MVPLSQLLIQLGKPPTTVCSDWQRQLEPWLHRPIPDFAEDAIKKRIAWMELQVSHVGELQGLEQVESQSLAEFAALLQSWTRIESSLTERCDPVLDSLSSNESHWSNVAMNRITPDLHRRNTARVRSTKSKRLTIAAKSRWLACAGIAFGLLAVCATNGDFAWIDDRDGKDQSSGARSTSHSLVRSSTDFDQSSFDLGKTTVDGDHRVPLRSADQELVNSAGQPQSLVDLNESVQPQTPEAPPLDRPLGLSLSHESISDLPNSTPLGVTSVAEMGRAESARKERVTSQQSPSEDFVAKQLAATQTEASKTWSDVSPDALGNSTVRPTGGDKVPAESTALSIHRTGNDVVVLQPIPLNLKDYQSKFSLPRNLRPKPREVVWKVKIQSPLGYTCEPEGVHEIMEDRSTTWILHDEASKAPRPLIVVQVSRRVDREGGLQWRVAGTCEGLNGWYVPLHPTWMDRLSQNLGQERNELQVLQDMGINAQGTSLSSSGKRNIQIYQRQLEFAATTIAQLERLRTLLDGECQFHCSLEDGRTGEIRLVCGDLLSDVVDVP